MNHGLTNETLAEIHRVLAQQPEVEKAILYGSRAKGTQRTGSDVDLALIGPGLDDRILGRIADDFEDGWRLIVSIFASSTESSTRHCSITSGARVQSSTQGNRPKPRDNVVKNVA